MSTAAYWLLLLLLLLCLSLCILQRWFLYSLVLIVSFVILPLKSAAVDAAACPKWKHGFEVEKRSNENRTEQTEYVEQEHIGRKENKNASKRMHTLPKREPEAHKDRGREGSEELRIQFLKTRRVVHF